MVAEAKKLSVLKYTLKIRQPINAELFEVPSVHVCNDAFNCKLLRNIYKGHNYTFFFSMCMKSGKLIAKATWPVGGLGACSSNPTSLEKAISAFFCDKLLMN